MKLTHCDRCGEPIRDPGDERKAIIYDEIITLCRAFNSIVFLEAVKYRAEDKERL